MPRRLPSSAVPFSRLPTLRQRIRRHGVFPTVVRARLAVEGVRSLSARQASEKPSPIFITRSDQEDSPVPSIPPPLPPLRERRSILGLDWSPIVASMSLGVATIVGVVAWIATHPHHPPSAQAPASELLALVRVEPAAMPTLAAAPTVGRTSISDVVIDHLPPIEDAPVALPPPPVRATRPQPLPEPEPPLPQPSDAAPAPPRPAGETYGTQVLFLNNRASASETAKREHKLLFVMHISGNFEDSCFT